MSGAVASALITGPRPETVSSTVSWASAARELGCRETFASIRWTLSPSCSILDIFSPAYSRNRSDTVTLRPLIMQLVVSQGISMIVSTLIGAVTLAFQSGVLALIYVDLRMRKEGFDVVLMREMETTGPDTPGIPGASGQPVSPGAAGGPFPGPAPTL